LNTSQTSDLIMVICHHSVQPCPTVEHFQPRVCFFKINIYFQEAFSQSHFQKGPELNKQIYKEDNAYTT
jgi:hypothetical protein